MQVCDKTEKIIEMYTDDKMTSVEIAKVFGCSSSTIQRILKKNGIKPYHSPNEIRLTKEQIEDIVMRYELGETSIEIAADYNLCDNSIRKVLREQGIIIRKAKRRSIVNRHDFFKEIDSVEKAYFLGWMISDGSIVQQRGGREDVISLEIHRDDMYILELFADSIECAHGSIGTFEKRNHSHLRFASREMSEDLSKYGVVPRKTRITYLPRVSDDLMPHLIRGIFDGDGTITIDKYGVAHIAFYGSERLCNDISSYLHDTIGVNMNKVSKSTCYHVWWGGKTPVKAIGNYLYKDCGKYYLPRKFDKFVDYM